MTTSPRLESVLYETEIPTLLDKLRDTDAITGVDGLSREEILQIGNSYSNPNSWRDALRNSIVNNAITQTHFSKIGVSSYGEFMDITGDKLNTLMVIYSARS